MINATTNIIDEFKSILFVKLVVVVAIESKPDSPVLYMPDIVLYIIQIFILFYGNLLHYLVSISFLFLPLSCFYLFLVSTSFLFLPLSIKEAICFRRNYMTLICYYAYRIIVIMIPSTICIFYKGCIMSS
jgi:hypothetical protein